MKYKLSAKHTEGGNSISSNTCETLNKPLFPPLASMGLQNASQLITIDFTFFKKKLNLLIYVFLAVLGLHCYMLRLSLVVASRGCFLVAVRGLLIVVASLVVEHGF